MWLDYVRDEAFKVTGPGYTKHRTEALNKFEGAVELVVAMRMNFKTGTAIKHAIYEAKQVVGPMPFLGKPKTNWWRAVAREVAVRLDWIPGTPRLPES